MSLNFGAKDDTSLMLSLIKPSNWTDEGFARIEPSKDIASLLQGGKWFCNWIRYARGKKFEFFG